MWARSALIAGFLAAGMAQANSLPPINQDRHIMDSLFSAAVGHAIRKTCPTIDARMFRAIGAAWKLKQYALDKGYSEQQIDALLDSDIEKDAMKARVVAYLKKNGVTLDDAASYCALGLREIDKGSLIGWLLIAK